MEEVQKAGVEVIYPEKQPFVEALEPYYVSLQNQPEVYELMIEIQGLDYE